MLTSENEEEKLSDTQKVENNAPPLKAMAFENVHVSLTSAIEAERKVCQAPFASKTDHVDLNLQ